MDSGHRSNTPPSIAVVEMVGGFADLGSKTSTTPVLAGEFDIGMADTIMPSESICAAESLLISAEIASHLLLARIVDGILMPSEVVGPREDGVAGLAGARVDTVALVWSRLAVQQARSHTHGSADFGTTLSSHAVCLPMTLPLVLLE